MLFRALDGETYKICDSAIAGSKAEHRARYNKNVSLQKHIDDVTEEFAQDPRIMKSWLSMMTPEELLRYSVKIDHEEIDPLVKFQKILILL